MWPGNDEAPTDHHASTDANLVLSGQVQGQLNTFMLVVNPAGGGRAVTCYCAVGPLAVGQKVLYSVLLGWLSSSNSVIDDDYDDST